MEHAAVYMLSKKYGPPRINLRDAELLDSYGDDSWAKRPINHRVPEDVSLEDLKYYGWVYAFMAFEDLLFYLYPVVIAFEQDQTLDCIDSLMYSLDRFIPTSSSKLSKTDQSALCEGLTWLWEVGSPGYADWVQCPNLQKFIGIEVTWDDLDCS